MTDEAPPSRSRNGPDFLCIGLRKAGTRWLYAQLESHPDFAMPPIKELHFFDRRFPTRNMLVDDPRAANTEEGARFFRAARAMDRSKRHGMAAYATLFAFAGERLTGDITPAYGNDLAPELIAEIARAFPSLKVVLMLRDPIGRFWSNANDIALKGKLGPTDLGRPDRIASLLERPILRDASYPTRIHARWRAAFGDRIQHFFLDDVIDTPSEARAAIVKHLGGDPALMSAAVSVSHNNKAGRARVPFSDEVRAALVDLFADELRACAEVFGGAASRWPAKYGLSSDAV